MSIQQKNEITNIANGKFRHFLKSKFVEVNRLFAVVYLNRNNDAEQFKTRKYYLPKGIIVNYNVTIYGKNIYGQAIGSYIKRYGEIRKLTTGQGESYTTGCLLDHDYIKNCYRLKAAHLNKQKELDADPKAIQQIEFIEQLKNVDGVNADRTQNMFILTTLEKIKETRLKHSQGSLTVL